ncbi:FkbM family methyltransferase [Nostoc sp.]|uniref:FkbM family methyltransferase n=1 Tax=Nostoc sp. TaxID=1180 RepID=UPI002FF63974
MGIQKNIQTFISNPGIQKRYLIWQATRLTTGHLPYIELPKGQRLFPADRFNDFHAIATQHPDINEFNLVDTLLSTSSKGVFVDVGANVGAMTLLAHSTGRVDTILAFEPTHRYCSAWHYNVAYNGIKNATLIQTAVGDRIGEVDFRVDPTMPLNNKINKGQVHFSSQTQKVKIVTLDSVCNALNIDRITLLKIDVEGAEPLVIRGAKQLLKERRIQNILLEFIVEFIEDMDEDPYSFVQMLNELDFDLYEINPNGTLGQTLDYKEVVDARRVLPDAPLRPFHGINLVAQLQT